MSPPSVAQLKPRTSGTAGVRCVLAAVLSVLATVLSRALAEAAQVAEPFRPPGVSLSPAGELLGAVGLLAAGWLALEVQVLLARTQRSAAWGPLIWAPLVGYVILGSAAGVTAKFGTAQSSLGPVEAQGKAYVVYDPLPYGKSQPQWHLLLQDSKAGLTWVVYCSAGQTGCRELRSQIAALNKQFGKGAVDDVSLSVEPLGANRNSIVVRRQSELLLSGEVDR